MAWSKQRLRAPRSGLESHSEPGRWTKVTALKVGRAGLEHIHLVAPAQQARQPKIDSEAQILGKRRIGADFGGMNSSEQDLPERPEPASPGSAAQTNQEIALAHAAILSADVGNRPKIV